MSNHQNSDKTSIILHLLVLQLRDKVEGGSTPILQKPQLLKFYRLYVRVYREKKSCNFSNFSSNFYEILHNYSKDIIKIHDNCICIFGSKIGFLNKNSFIFETTGLLQKQE